MGDAATAAFEKGGVGKSLVKPGMTGEAFSLSGKRYQHSKYPVRHWFATALAGLRKDRYAVV